MPIFESWDLIDVETAARALGCSGTRIRKLLRAGRLSGYKDELAGPWKIVWPLRLKPGKRGPDFKNIRTRLPNGTAGTQTT